MKFGWISAILLGVTLPLESCNLNTNVENLLTPPKLSDTQEEIYSALQSAVGNNIRLKYPQNGEHKSAFVVEELDTDGEKEAIVLYEQTDENVMRINFLRQTERGWKSISDYGLEGSDVEQLYLQALGENSRINLIVSTTLNQTEKIVEVFNCTEEGLTSTLKKNYGAFCLVKNEEEKDLFLVSSQKGTGLFGELYHLNQDGIYYESVIPLNEGMQSVVSVCQGTSDDYLYVDGSLGNNVLRTDILQVKNDALQQVYSDNEDSGWTTRAEGIPCGDVDGDGRIEIPKGSTITGEIVNTESETEFLNLTAFYVYEQDSFRRSHVGLYTDYFIFFYPDLWIGTVTVKRDPIQNEWIFQKSGEKTQELLKICMAESEDAPQKQEEGYRLYAIIDDVYYLGKENQSADRDYILQESEISGLLTFLQS